MKVQKTFPLILSVATILFLLPSSASQCFSNMQSDRVRHGMGAWGSVDRLHAPGTISIAAGDEPLADFEGDPTYGAEPLTVQFTDYSTVSTGEITGWFWDFGDKTTSQEQYPQHTYTVPGAYTVSLTVKGPGGTNTKVEEGYITVTEAGSDVFADFTADPIEGEAPLTVQFMDASSGEITDWFWDFGDNNASTEQNPQHTYIVPNTYTVSLTVKGPGGTNTMVKEGCITVTEAGSNVFADFTADPIEGEAPLTVQFMDASAGEITDWFWDFGDNNASTEQNPQHTYIVPNTYTVSLTVKGPGGSDTVTEVDCIWVTGPEVIAGFAAEPLEGNAPLTVQFTDTSAGKITKWLWDFGDGSTSPEQNPKYTYTLPGAYTVSLTVYAQDVSDTITGYDYIWVYENAVEAYFSADPLDGEAPLTVQFSDASTGEITEWMWNFGDGNASSEQNPQHIYTIPGEYTVSLTVTGLSATNTMTEESYILVNPSGNGYSVSGTITGTIMVGVEIYINGQEERVVTTELDGTYTFEGLPSGSYSVTPYKEGVTFEPSSQDMEISMENVPGVDFTAEAEGPAFVSAQADPFSIPNDGVTQILFTVQVRKQTGPVSVSADLSPLGGDAEQALYDDNTHGDISAGDGIYSYRATAASATPPGLASIVVRASDDSGRENVTSIECEVISTINDTVSESSSQTHTIKNEIKGQSLVLRFSLTGEGITAQSPPTCSVLLQVIKPDGTAYLAQQIPITASISELKIKGAETGTWTYSVTNQCTEGRQYSISTTTAGTGLITGMVIDAATGEGISGVSISTNGGASTATEEGYYMLIHPAGTYSITAMDAKHGSVPKSFTLEAGADITINQCLGAKESGGGDNNKCPVKSIFKHETKYIRMLRTLRDSYMRKTPAGSRYISLYYSYGSEVTAMLQADPLLRKELRQCIMDMAPLIKNLSAGKSFTATTAQVHTITRCAEHIKAHASSGLREEIGKFIRNMDKKEFLNPKPKIPNCSGFRY